MWEELVEG